MDVLKTAHKLQKVLEGWAGSRIALVPTMGSIHEGHLSLVDIARQHCDRVVVSLFVNPIQFAPDEDFRTYPRSFETDLFQLEQRGADLLYAPKKQEIYPEGLQNLVPHRPPADISEVLEGAHRPHFFRGVVTVVGRLLEQCSPHVAVFGEKDYQQLLVIRRFVEESKFHTSIMAGPVVREADGLALSSRNAYLSPQQRTCAAALYRILHHTAQRIWTGDTLAVLHNGRDDLHKAGFSCVDYLSLRHENTFEPLTAPSPHGRLLAAVRLGTIRLIDNIPLTEGTTPPNLEM